MNQRIIKTKLIGKEELFNVLALGEACKLPVLLLGEPGVGKTQALLDYAAAKYNYNFSEVKKKTFVIELDEGTKTSEIKGRVNMKSLLEDKEYKVDAPIADAKFILINEVDKGTSGVRNTLLSVMRERALFYGNEIKKCDWDVFTGSCNLITDDEADNPFWDRFVLTTKVERIGNDKMKTLIDKGLRVGTVTLNIPTMEEIEQVKLPKNHMNKFLDVIYSEVSDRSCSYLPLLTKAVKLVYGFEEDVDTIMKTCELLSPSKLSELASKLESKRESLVRTNIENLPGVIRGNADNNEAYIKTFLGSIFTELAAMSKMSTYKNKVVHLANEVYTAIDDCDINMELKQICFNDLGQSIDTTDPFTSGGSKNGGQKFLNKLNERIDELKTRGAMQEEDQEKSEAHSEVGDDDTWE